MFCFRPDNLGSLSHQDAKNCGGKNLGTGYLVERLSLWVLASALGVLKFSRGITRAYCGTPQNLTFGAQKVPHWKGKSSSTPPFFGSMLVFRGSGCRCKMIWDDFWIMLAFTKVWEPSDNQGGKLWVSCFLEIHRFSDFSVIAVRIYIYTTTHVEWVLFWRVLFWIPLSLAVVTL